MGPRYDEILTPEALPWWPRSSASSARAGPSCWPPGPTRQRELSAGAMLEFLPQTAAIRADTAWRVAPPGAGPGRPAGRDHRADRPEDDDQRPELGGQGLAGRLRGRQHAAVGQHGHRPAQPEGRAGPHDRLHQRRRARPTSCGPTTSWPPSWSGRAAGTWTRSTCWSTAQRVSGSLFDFGAVLHPLRAAPAGQGQGPVLLPGQDGEPSGGPAVERRLHAGPGRARASRAARSGPRC